MADAYTTLTLPPDGDGAGSTGEPPKPATVDGTDVRHTANQDGTDVRQVDFKEVVGLRKETRETAAKLTAMEGLLTEMRTAIQKIAPREDAKPPAAATNNQDSTAAAALAATRSLALSPLVQGAGVGDFQP